jgi:hypothetical protein
LVAFIADFVTTYNSETARKAEIAKADNSKKNDKRYFRKLVTEQELNSFYSILD